MTKVFLDTNVILDSVIPSRDNYIPANIVLSACDEGMIKGCVSVLTVANVAYILKRGRAVNVMVNLLRETFEGIDILPMDNSQVQSAYVVDAPDFEDVLQYECAKSAGCSLIVTSNVKHFKFCKGIEVVTTVNYAKLFSQMKD